MIITAIRIQSKRASVLRFFELTGENRKFSKFPKFEQKLWRKLMTREISRLLSPVPNRPPSCSPRPCIIRKFEKGRSLQQSKTRWGKIENRISANNFGAKIARKWISWISWIFNSKNRSHIQCSEKQ